MMPSPFPAIVPILRANVKRQKKFMSSLVREGRGEKKEKGGGRKEEGENAEHGTSNAER